MPRDLFAEAGINPTTRAPRDLFAEAGIDPHEPSKIGKVFNAYKDFGNTQLDVINSLGHGVQQAIAAPLAGAYNLINRATGKHLQEVNPQFDKQAPIPSVGTLGEVAGALATPIPGVGKLQALAKGKGLIANTLARLTEGGAIGAGANTLYGAANPNSNIGKDAATGGLFGALLNAVIPGGAAAINSITKLGKRSPEEIEKISKTIGNAPVNIADVTDSPLLKKVQAITREIPFSGAKTSESKLINAIDDAASNFTNSLKGTTNKENSEIALLDEVRSNRNAHKIETRKNYNAIRDKAKEAYSPDLLGGQVKGITINPAKSMSAYEQALKIDRDLKLPVKDLVDDVANNNVKSYSYNDFHNFQSDVRKAANSAVAAGDNQAAASLTKIREAMLDDMRTSLNKSNTPELVNQFDSARKYHRENVAPYEKSENAPLYRAIIGKNTPENAIKVLLRPENTKIVEHMSPEQRNLLAYNFLKKRIITDSAGKDAITPSNLVNTIDSMPERYKQLLFNKKQLAEINQIKTLNRLTQEVRAHVTPPKTGFSLKGNLADALKAALGAGALHLGMSAPAAGGTIAGMGALSHVLRRYMESPKTRQSFVKQQIVNPKKANTLTNALIRSISQQNAGGDQ